ncbi:NAD(P)/FAD-dependent oxidoreductase [Caldisalinibacter kiritimatiensis]|uniref:Putative FAD-dependent dehydrogenase n=1 Tax=Caldisalinibacter kiritimatiensis TaxID=1304284 RepID=R1ATQ7_9FIRM|nr:NAD(P)/FAD-dependent oxidoreductase [Caldisalinibacter kiritimatiensis]EOD00022.1 putative FAD-dependent dehydrogenase [Caldisalinibacter kiritimatiensis]
MSKKNYDVIIVGGGPAGIFTALELLKLNQNLDILLLEKGRNIQGRTCPIKTEGSKCVGCKPCSIVNGWGGAGAFSDGKLTLTSEFGGVLNEYMPKKDLEDMISYVDRVYMKFGATEEVHGTNTDKIRDIQKLAASADLKLIPAKVKHLGTERCFNILKRMQEYLQERITIKYLSPVENILTEKNKVVGVKTKNNEEYYSEYVVVMPGREGSEWFKNECNRLGLNMKNNAVDIGVRVEVPAVVLKDITDVVYESKLIYYTKSFDDRVRTFCMNPYGEVVVENNDGIKTVNGHSYAERKTENTNFALLVSKEFTEPFKSPIAYGKYIATLANMLGDGVIVQRLGDLLDGRRTTHTRLKRSLVQPTLTDATPGDLSLVLPYRHLQDIVEMLEAMDKVAPGVYSKHTLLYGVEVKFYSSRVKLTNKLETEIENLFAAGDGAGVTRGLAQASVAGVVVAREINERLNK